MMNAETERHIEEARASLMAHVGELGRRFKAARERFDLPAHIAAHPIAAAGAALALGALLGMGGRRSHDGGNGGGLGRALFAGLGALAIRFAKDYAIGEATDAAKRWLDGDDDDAAHAPVHWTDRRPS